MLRTPDSDERLARRAAGGDRGAFDEIVRRHRDRVYAVGLRICGSEADAEDVLQETFLSAWRGLGGFGGRAQLSTWLYRIATNRALDLVRGRRPQTPLEAVPEPAAAGDEVEDAATRRAVLAALARLPDEFRAAAVLGDVLGLTPTELADVLEVPVGTAKSRLFRARALLARELSAGGREPRAPAGVQGGDGDA
jgi:RNA polymerase sigma-70 factor (ECF subfamily)